MAQVITVQGRTLDEAALAAIRQLLADHPEWSQYRLSRELATAWNWRNGVGQLKDIACRSLLRKLAVRQVLGLPAARCVSPNRFRHQPVAPVAVAPRPYQGPLRGLQPLTVTVVNGTPAARRWASLLAAHHYLSYRQPVGENVQYLVQAADGREVACLLFGAAAWRCAVRDRYIGWDEATRAAGLAGVVNNQRFLILPWIVAPHLASHVLGRVLRRLRADWQGRYGHAPWLVETFVERARFRGTCYRAVNWVTVGATTGRSRQDRYKQLVVPVKDVYVYVLAPRTWAGVRAGAGQQDG